MAKEKKANGSLKMCKCVSDFGLPLFTTVHCFCVSHTVPISIELFTFGCMSSTTHLNRTIQILMHTIGQYRRSTVYLRYSFRHFNCQNGFFLHKIRITVAPTLIKIDITTNQYILSAHEIRNRDCSVEFAASFAAQQSKYSLNLLLNSMLFYFIRFSLVGVLNCPPLTHNLSSIKAKRTTYVRILSHYCLSRSPLSKVSAMQSSIRWNRFALFLSATASTVKKIIPLHLMCRLSSDAFVGKMIAIVIPEGE